MGLQGSDLFLIVSRSDPVSWHTVSGRVPIPPPRSLAICGRRLVRQPPTMRTVTASGSHPMDRDRVQGDIDGTAGQTGQTSLPAIEIHQRKDIGRTQQH